MRYMLLIYGDEYAQSQTENEACYQESAGLAREIDAKGQFLAAAPLLRTTEAKSVKMRAGKRIVTDGPFAETREQLGGYFMVEAESMEEAIDIAAKIPGGRWGTVEVRPVLEIDGVPEK